MLSNRQKKGGGGSESIGEIRASDHTGLILAAIERLQVGLEELRVGQDQLRVGQDQLRVGQDQLRVGQDQLQGGVEELRSSVAELRRRRERLETQFERVHDTQIRLRVDLMARMDRLQDDITRVRDDIAVNYGAPDQTRRTNGNTREELRALSDMVSGMLRQIINLQTDVRNLRGSA